ncbi:hypothetical protein JCM11491_001354 [Sporobolomyces phaffii]
MDSSSAGMQMRERRVRESSYHPIASDSEDGAISDGDPPFYAATSSINVPPPPLTAPVVPVPVPVAVPASPVAAAPTRPPNVNTESLVGAMGGAPTAVANPPKKAGKRSFEELEDIVFANPRSFATLAFAVAESRGVTLIVTDDRTHKVTSAYMHITCAFRRAGCPFVLKLIKAKEGGWVLKGAKSSEPKTKAALSESLPPFISRGFDIKQRSVYRCRHPAGAVPEVTTGPGSLYSTIGPAIGPTTTTSYPTPTSLEGGVGVVSKPKAAKPARAHAHPHVHAGDEPHQRESSVGKVTRGPGRPRSTAPQAVLGGYGTPTSRMTTPTTSSSAPQASAAAAVGPADGASQLSPHDARGAAALVVERALADRALAPPFERSLHLQSKIVPVLRGGEPTSGFSAPRGGVAARGGSADLLGGASYDPSSPRRGGGGGVARRGSSYDVAAAADAESTLATVPVIAYSDPRALPAWTNLLRELTPRGGPAARASSSSESTTGPAGGRKRRRPSSSNSAASSSPEQDDEGDDDDDDLGGAPSLVPLAQVLAHPYMSVTPWVFFAASTTSEMRSEVLAGLPVDKVGVWNKVWAKQVLLSSEAEHKWSEIAAAQAAAAANGTDDAAAADEDTDMVDGGSGSGGASRIKQEATSPNSDKKPRRYQASSAESD